jgi:diguanylate cyclase (GGDEF)-like protein/PAS domain S-box-containing protein
MVVTPRGPLGGALDAVLPWAALAGCLAATALIAGFLEVAARRRDHAVALAGALRESERSFRQLFADNPQPMWAYDLETLRFLDVNETAIEKYGYSRDEFLAMRITDIRPESDRDRLLANLRSRGARPVDSSGPWQHRLRDGRLIDVTITSHNQDFGGRRAALVCVRDVTLERALEERLRHHALHDPLTGAGNRELLMAQLGEMLDTSATMPCTLLLVDIAGMKSVNDSLGRDGADELLVAACERLAGAAGDGAHIARLGGDVFGATTSAAPYVDVAKRWAENVVAAVVDPYTIGEHTVTVAASAGLALGEAGIGPRELLRNADVALETAKETRAARARHIELFDAERDQARQDRVALEADLRGAVEAGQLRLVYQPQLDLGTSRITGVEALVRWEHPEHGMLSPAVFLPIAEQCGLMPLIDTWVIATACRQAREWLDRGLPQMTMSVNICGHDVDTGPALVEHVHGELERNRLPGGVLEIELTESVALRDREEAETVLGELRALGVRVALDDFGTGYSTLDRVRDLPMDRVKIDRTFVRRASGEGASLLRAIIAMAHSLGLATVAEGVETQQELELLTLWGCDTVQGFLVSRPVPPADIDALMAATLAGASAPTVSPDDDGPVLVASGRHSSRHDRVTTRRSTRTRP